VLWAAVLAAALAVAAGAITLSSVHRPGRTPAAQAVDPRDPALSLTEDPARKRIAAQITSTFENATVEIQYDYVENIGDGRGITAGRAGFTSATGDLLLLVRRYTDRSPENPLAQYIPDLEAVNGTDSENGLDGFAEDWVTAAQDPAQRALQDDLVDELYFEPAMTMAAGAGIRTPLGQAIIWDTMIQHGGGGQNGTEAIIAETEADQGPVGADEPAWLEAFLDVRLRHLLETYADTTADAEESSRSRVDALRGLVSDDELALQLPISWEVYGQEFSLPAS
jgi:chitosanase